jgi:hypothetical protein
MPAPILRPLPVYQTVRRCQTSRLQEHILAAVYQIIVPSSRQLVPSIPAMQPCQGEQCAASNSMRNALREEAA